MPWNPLPNENPFVRQYLKTQKEGTEPKPQPQTARPRRTRPRREMLGRSELTVFLAELENRDVPVGEKTNPEKIAYRNELRDLLKQALQDKTLLTDIEAAILNRIYFDEQRIYRIAHDLNLDTKTVSSSHKEALAKLAGSKYFSGLKSSHYRPESY